MYVRYCLSCGAKRTSRKDPGYLIEHKGCGGMFVNQTTYYRHMDGTTAKYLRSILIKEE